MYRGRTLQVEGMYRDRHYNWEECNAEECTGDGHYKWKECTGTDITSERNVQGQTLQVRGMYSGQRLHVRGIGDRHYKWEDSTGDRQTDITSKRKLQGTDARWRSHWWTLHHTVCWAAHKTLRSACLFLSENNLPIGCHLRIPCWNIPLLFYSIRWYIPYGIPNFIYLQTFWKYDDNQKWTI